jgi:uncharacterized protein YecE (DUF72 family)
MLQSTIAWQLAGLRETMTDQSAHLGTSSWLFDAWRGVFYPERLPRNQYLSHYATQFDTVEVNTSFYALPAPSTLITWVESVPAGFTFALKFPRAISHDKRLVQCEAETLEFLDALRALGPVAAPAFLQLPPDFTRAAYGRQFAAYLDWLAVAAADLRMAVEVRAPDLLTPAFAAFLAQRGFAAVLVDRVGTPDLYPAWFDTVAAGAGPAFAFIRWIGDDRRGPQGDRELQVFRDAQLTAWTARIAELTQHGKTVYGYVHNPYEGHAPASVRRLQNLLAAHISLPSWPPAEHGGDAQLRLL